MLESEWAQCLGCATIEWSRVRVGMERGVPCERCFQRYCWGGVAVEDKIVGPMGGMWEETEHAWANELKMVLKPGVSHKGWNETHQY